MPDTDKSNKATLTPTDSPDNLTVPVEEKGWIDTEDRITEILFGLIMALTFTCTISIAESDEATVKEMLIGAFGCNTAWGLVDAVLYIMMARTTEKRGFTILDFVRRSNDKSKAHQFIGDAMPRVIANVLQPEEMEKIRQRILQLPEPKVSRKQIWKDYKIAVGIFFLVLLSTLPVAAPFMFIDDVQTALRISNAIAILMMFFCGWALGKYAGRNRFLMGITMSVLGIVLVLVTIALGG
jgi:VIT1/CCC1 family predicted Fe2+/Mn2+ transporter